MGAKGIDVGAVGDMDPINPEACWRRILFLYSLVLRSPRRELNITVHYKIHQPDSPRPRLVVTPFDNIEPMVSHINEEGCSAYCGYCDQQ